MRFFCRWHILLIPLPILGWLLLLAYGLDEYSGRSETSSSDRWCSIPECGLDRRLLSAGADYLVVIVAWSVLPAAFGWVLGACYLLFRDAGGFRWSLGRLLTKYDAIQRPYLSFTDSFSRNLPLLIPYLGPIMETALVMMGKPRLGDRLVALSGSRAKL